MGANTASFTTKSGVLPLLRRTTTTCTHRYAGPCAMSRRTRPGLVPFTFSYVQCIVLHVRETGPAFTARWTLPFMSHEYGITHMLGKPEHVWMRCPFIMNAMSTLDQLWRTFFGGWARCLSGQCCVEYAFVKWANSTD